ncbi:MAG: TIM barrel protein [Candidatus Atribacteria bacterium]|nr:TIM barrel protein [Candidatus Atribacteria bacterium]
MLSHFEDKKLRKRIKQILDQGMMEVHFNTNFAGTVPWCRDGGNLNTLDETRRRKDMDAFYLYLDEALEMGATQLIFGSNTLGKEGNREGEKEQLKKSIIEICRYLKENSINKEPMYFSLEHCDTDVDKKALIGHSLDTHKFVLECKKEVNNIGILFDMSHVLLLREDPAEEIKKMKDTVIQIHLANCTDDPKYPWFGDCHIRFGKDGLNNIDTVTRLFKSLIGINYFEDYYNKNKRMSIVALEVRALNDEIPEVVRVNTQRVLEQAWSRACLEVE